MEEFLLKLDLGKNMFTWQLFHCAVGSCSVSTPPLGQIYNIINVNIKGALHLSFWREQ